MAIDALLASWPTLAASDFPRKDPPPHVGLVYVWIVYLRSRPVALEGERFLAGDQRSRQFINRDVGGGFVTSILAALPVAQKLVADGFGDTLIPLVYVGQELRGPLP